MDKSLFWHGRDLSAELDRIQGKLADLGLLRTMHAVNKAVQSLGWELAEKIEKQKRAEQVSA
jgi:hypothetical protein